MNENINTDKNQDDLKNMQKIEEDMLIIKYNNLRKELEEEMLNKRMELIKSWTDDRKKIKDKYER
jgi:hypothetical protein